MRCSKESIKSIGQPPLLPCPTRSLCKTASIECLAVIVSKSLRNPLHVSYSFSPHSIYSSAESAFAFGEAVHADSRCGIFHKHIQSLEFKRMDFESSVMLNLAIAINCLSLRSVHFYGCRITHDGIISLGETWHNECFMRLKHFAFEECDDLLDGKSVTSQRRSCVNLDSIISKFSRETDDFPDSRRIQIISALEHLSFRNSLLSSSSKLLLTTSLHALTNLTLLDISGTGEWTAKAAFLLGQCISALPKLRTWLFDRVDLCQPRSSDVDTQKSAVTDSHMLLLGLRMKPQSEFSPLYFQEDWTYTYDKKERFQSVVAHLSLSHSCSTPGMGSMALASILNCFPQLESVNFNSSIISYASASHVFSQVHIRCPKLRQADFSRCSGRKSPSYIIDICLQLKFLTTLLLGFNNIWDIHVQSMCKALSKDTSLMPYLHTLDLSYNEITNLGASYLAALFRQRDVKNSKHIRHLGMRSNKIQNLGVCLLAAETSYDTLLDFRGVLSDDLSAAWLLWAIKSTRNVGRCKFNQEDILPSTTSAEFCSKDLLMGFEFDHRLALELQYPEWERSSKTACQELMSQIESTLDLLIVGKVPAL